MISNAVMITIDVDWAPDFAIREVADRLSGAAVRATWFLTHRSKAIDELCLQTELFEMGIHPNFLPGSSHGSHPESVLEHCLSLFPQAASMRSHGLFASTALLDLVIRKTEIQVDGTLFLPRTRGLRPVEYFWAGRSLLRVPHFFEDDFEMHRPSPDWRVESFLAIGEGLKVFDFHPIHVVLNSKDLSAYERLKERRKDLSQVTPEDLKGLVWKGRGAGTLFDELVEHMARIETQSLTFQDLANLSRDQRAKELGSSIDPNINHRSRTT